MSQTIIDFQYKVNYDESSFLITSCNEQTFKGIISFPLRHCKTLQATHLSSSLHLSDNKNSYSSTFNTTPKDSCSNPGTNLLEISEQLEMSTVPSQDNVFLLYGEKYSGKTHLANIWQKRNNATFLNETDLEYPQLQKHYSYVLEDIDKYSGDKEVLIYNIINVAKENDAYLLLTGSSLIFSLPDLLSRLLSIKQISIAKPDAELIQGIVTKILSDNEITISKTILEYIATFAHREFSFINSITNKIISLGAGNLDKQIIQHIANNKDVR